MRSARLAPVLLLALAAACKVYDPLYCEADRDCDDPERPFCDVEGIYPASDGIKRTCIADPVPVTPPMPDFSIEVDAAAVQVRIDGEATVRVSIARLDGFSEDIEIRAEGLPAGVTAASTTVASDAEEATVTFTGNEEAIGSKTMVTVVARTSELERTAELELLVLGRPGALDPTFGLLGIATERSSGSLGTDEATDLLAYPDGSLMVAGDSLTAGLATLVRFLPDGSRDESFGPNGRRNFDCNRIGLVAESAYRFDQQSTGNTIVATGGVGGDYALGRLDVDGDFDPGFREGGLVRVTTPSRVSVSRVVTGPSDEILVSQLVGDSRDRIWINRFTADGDLDGGFAGGRAEIDLGDLHQFAALSVFRDGSVLGTATATVDGVNRSFVFKLTPQGALDVDFADGGVLQLSPEELAFTALQAEGGDILLAGHVTLEVVRTPALWRLDARGEPVLSFGEAGRALIPLSGDRSGSVRSLIAVDDSRVLAIGEPGITVIALSPVSGELDVAFGNSGLSITAFDDPIRSVSAVLLPDGRFAVLADEDSLPLALARFFL